MISCLVSSMFSVLCLDMAELSVILQFASEQHGPVLHRLGLPVQARSAVLNVTDASADEISSLKSKVDDSLLVDICLAKLKAVEEREHFNALL